MISDSGDDADRSTGSGVGETSATAEDPYLAMLKGPLLPTVIVALVVCPVATVVAGTEGLAGSVLGVVVTVASFATSLIVMSRTARSAPHNVMAVALLTYVTKIGLLGLLLVLLMDATWLSGGAFAAGAISTVLVWVVFEIRAYSNARIFVVDAPGESSGR